MHAIGRRIGRLEVRTLLGLAAVSAALWAFLGVADEVGEDETVSIDRRLLLALRTPGNLDDPVGPRWFEESARDVTALGGFTFLTVFLLITAAALFYHSKRRQAWVLLGTVAAAELSTEMLKLFYDRPRPDLVQHGSFVYSHSFPSGHSTLSAAAVLTAAMILASLERRRRAKTFVFAAAILLIVGIGVSRVYLGVHWPTDVLAGWTLGAGWALAARIALTATRPTRTAAGEEAG